MLSGNSVREHLVRVHEGNKKHWKSNETFGSKTICLVKVSQGALFPPFNCGLQFNKHLLLVKEEL